MLIYIFSSFAISSTNSSCNFNKDILRLLFAYLVLGVLNTVRSAAGLGAVSGAGSKASSSIWVLSK